MFVCDVCGGRCDGMIIYYICYDILNVPEKDTFGLDLREQWENVFEVQK